MKNKILYIKKDNSGITLISLVVTIIVLIILASVGIDTGITSINSAKLTQFTTQMKIMQIEVNDLFERSRSEGTVVLKDGTEFTGAEIIEGIGKDLSEATETQVNKVFQVAGENGSDITDRDGYRFFDKDTIKSLKIEGVDQEFLVNIETRTVISYKGLKYYDNLYYTLEQLPDSLYNVAYENPNTGTPSFDVSYEKLSDGNYEIKVSNIRYDEGFIGKWEIKYQRSDTDDTSKWYTSESSSFIVNNVGVYKVYVNQNGVQSGVKEVHIKYSKTEVEAADIANNPKEYYGAVVSNYKVDSSVADSNIKWKIFHADDKNIYLIASDYIKIANAPSKTVTVDEIQTTYSLNAGDTAYKGYFTDMLNAYNGSSDITDSRIKALNNHYFNEANNGAGYSSEEDNMKEVAYMLDTSIWNKYAMTGKAEYAIGGPTVELLFESYNKKYGTQYKARAKNSTGYEISKDNGANWANYYSEMLDTNDSLYVIKSISNAKAMWLASPSAKLTRYVMYVNYGGLVDGYGNSSTNCGFRPIVCLKSDVQLEEQGDGTYKIKDVTPDELPSIAGVTAPYKPDAESVVIENSTLETGLVVRDGNDNEWVWIEVPKTIYSSEVTATDYEGIYNALNTYASTYREGKVGQGRYWPDEWYDGSNVVGYVETTIADEAAYEEAVSEGTLYINKAGIEATSGRYSSSSKYYVVNTSATLTNTDGCGLSCSKYTENYKKMLTSVFTNGGFWIGRYEAGIDETTGAIVGDDTSISSLGRSSHTNITDKAISQKDAIPYNYVYCSEAQKLASEMTPDSSKTSSLMFGIQWDLVCKYLEQNATELGTTPENRVAKINSNSGDWGNYSNVALTINSDKAKQYSSSKWSAKTGEKAASGLLLSTGASTKTKVMNIYDFAGNEYEWTLEHATTDAGNPCANRGGYYGNSTSNPATIRGYNSTTYSYHSISFRPALY